MALAGCRRWAWLLGLCLSVGAASAEEQQVYPTQGTQRFLGLDDSSAPTAVGEGRAQALQNVLLSSSGDLRKRYGASLNVTVGTDRLATKDILDIQDEAFCAVTGVYYTKFSSGTERIVATCGKRFYYLNGVASWTVVDYNAATAGQNNQFVFTTALDNVILTNQVDAPKRYDGSTLLSLSFTGLTNAIQTAKTVSFFKNYLIFGNTSEASVNYPTRIRWSNIGTINTWTDADYIDLGTLGGQAINCMAELYDTLIIGLDTSMYKVSFVGGADTFQVSKVSDSHGCIAKNSIQNVVLPNGQNGLIFLDKDKEVNFYNGVIVQSMTGLIDTTMDGLSGSRLQYAVSALTPTDYWLCLTNSTGSVNDLCLDFNYEIGEWTKHVNVPANAMARVIDNNATDQVYYGSYKSLVYQLENTALRNDVGTTSPTTVTVDTVNTINTATASGLTVLYDSALSLTAGVLAGAPIELVGGVGSGQTNTIIDNTSTGLIVSDAFSPTPTSTTTAEVGAIDASYTTRWDAFGDPVRKKKYSRVDFWAEADVSSTISIAYATDYSSDVETLSQSLSSSTADAIWGSAIWGTAVWGDVNDVYRPTLLTPDNGRYIRYKFSDDDPNETFHLYGYGTVYNSGTVQ